MNRFVRGGNRLCKCICCGKNTHSNTGHISDVELCPVCLRSAEQVNSHSDNGHEKIERGCPTCQDVDCLHFLRV